MTIDVPCPLWVISGHFRDAHRCPLYPQKRTLRRATRMSAFCQKRTSRRARPVQCQPGTFRLYSRDMNEAFFAELSAWLTEAGLAGTSDTAIVPGFCDQ